jgi:alkylation response protein AidB-like acyl-CoA dehydrogenase
MADSSAPSLNAFRRDCERALARFGVARTARPMPNQSGESAHVAWAREFQHDLFEAGLAGIMYPEAVGGRGLGIEYQEAFNQAGEAYFFSPVFNVTLGVIGPTLMEFGSAAQQSAYIPRMLNGDDLWVQCLSEPGGGSDLAGARTSATRDGNEFRLSGSKMWTTNAQYADRALVLARTDSRVPKHRGLSMFVIDLGATGVTVVPIKMVDGREEFCQEFFDDVAVSFDALIGGENDGWAVARRVMFHERNMIAGSGFDGGVVEKRNWNPSVDEVLAIARERVLLDNDAVLELLAEAIVAKCTAEALRSWIPEQVLRGALPESGPSIAKLWSSTSNYRRSEIAVELSGLAGVIWDGPTTASGLASLWPGARSVTIGGGTNEVTRNQIAEHILGLPREPATDAGKPFAS